MTDITQRLVITQKWVDKFTQEIAELKSKDLTTMPTNELLFHKLYLRAVTGQMNTLLDEIEELLKGRTHMAQISKFYPHTELTLDRHSIEVFLLWLSQQRGEVELVDWHRDWENNDTPSPLGIDDCYDLIDTFFASMKKSADDANRRLAHPT